MPQPGEHMTSFTAADRLEALVRLCHALDLTITHTHEDLCFVEHNNFLFRLDNDDAAKAYAYLNKECQPAERAMFEKKLTNALRGVEGLNLELAGAYELRESKEVEAMELVLLEGE